MRVDNTTRLFEDLTDEECDEIAVFFERVLLTKEVPDILPAWAMQWLHRFEPNTRIQQVMLSSLPAYALLSVIRHRDTLDSNYGGTIATGCI